MQLFIKGLPEQVIKGKKGAMTYRSRAQVSEENVKLSHIIEYEEDIMCI